VSPVLPWWLRPWSAVRALRIEVSLRDAALETALLRVEELRGQNEQMRAETRLASGGSPAARPVGWEQPAGAVVPQLAVLVFGRGSEPGIRAYASRDLAGSVIEAAGLDDDARWRAHLVMGRLLVLNAPDFASALAGMARVWTAAPPSG